MYLPRARPWRFTETLKNGTFAATNGEIVGFLRRAADGVPATNEQTKSSSCTALMRSLSHEIWIEACVCVCVREWRGGNEKPS